jgi:RNA polymerase sigma-70 factor (ECF subfamily)
MGSEHSRDGGVTSKGTGVPSRAGERAVRPRTGAACSLAPPAPCRADSLRLPATARPYTGLGPTVNSPRPHSRRASETTGAVIERLVRDHQDAIRTYLTYLGAGPDQVDDLVQETFLSFLGSTFQERDTASTRAYLRTVARNHLLKEFRRRGSRPPMQDLEAADCAWEEYEGEDNGLRFRDALERCLATLREQSRDVLRMRYGNSTPRTTIAARLGMSESGVKSIIVRARRRLRECMERRLASSGAEGGP